jgi:hypothetical protein
MKYYLIFGVIGFAMIGMDQTEQVKMQTIKYRTFEVRNGREEKILYCLRVPKGGKLLTVTGSHERELEVSYPDSSFIYITNDAKSGSHLNYDNIASLNKGVYTEKLLKDTLLLEALKTMEDIGKRIS